jgi:hypothetical protein
MTFARLFDLCVCALAPAAPGCGSTPANVLSPSAEPSTASAEAEGVIAARLMPPRGDWAPNEVEVENAKLVSRDGDSPLQLRFQRSQPKMGETTVEGADEPIRVTVTYVEKKTRDKGTLVFLIAPVKDAEPGASIPVTVER